MSEVYVNEPSTSGKVVLHTSLGDLDVELWSRECPIACRNFLQLCSEGYYDGLIFHRLIKDFIVQTGDPTGTGRGGSDTAVKDGGLFDLEIHPRLKFRYRGLLGVANLAGGAPQAGSGMQRRGINGNQFFITLGRCDVLNNTHTLFGKVTGHSLYNLMKFNELEIDKNDRPIYSPILRSVDVIWMPFDDVQPRVEVLQQKQEQQQQRSCSGQPGEAGNGAREGARSSSSNSGEEQQKDKLQRPDKKLLSFTAEEEEEEEEEHGGGKGGEGGNELMKTQEESRETEGGRGSNESEKASATPAAEAALANAGAKKKIRSAHDVLENDPLLQKSSVCGDEDKAAADAKAAAEGRGSRRQRNDVAGGSESDASFFDDVEEEEEGARRRREREQRRKRQRRRSSSSDYSESNSSAGDRGSDSASSTDTRRPPKSRNSREVRDDSSSRRGLERETISSPSSTSLSTLTLVRDKLAALGAGQQDRSSSAGLNEEKQQQRQRQREKEVDRRRAQALRLYAGGGSASRGAKADRERLQDSDLMTESEKKRQLYVLRRRDMGRQRQQTDTLKKLDAFTQQLRKLQERWSSSHGSTAAEEQGSSSLAGESRSSSRKSKEEEKDCSRSKEEEKVRNSRHWSKGSSGSSRWGGASEGSSSNYQKDNSKRNIQDSKKKTCEPGTLNALLPDLDEEIDENDGSWLNTGGLRFAVDSNRAYELDEARAAASVVVYDPLRGSNQLAAKALQQRRQQQAVAWKEGRRDIAKW